MDCWHTRARAAVMAAAGLVLAACSSGAWPPPGLYHSVPGETLRAPRPEASSAKPSPRTYGVVEILPGDTLYAIAKRNGTTIGDLIAANGITSPDRIYAGQQLTLPGVGASRSVETAPATATPSRAEPASTETRTGSASRVGPKPVSPAATRAANPSPVRNASQRVPSKLVAPPRAGGRFAWPVSGRVISAYGAKGKGLHNDGINIAAKRGTAVKAAENGVVVYAGNELPGFGNLILIKHAGGWFTAYGHSEQLLVERGAKVKRGERIATIGSTGSVTTPQLHFEVRKGRKAVDPSQHLMRRS